MSLMNEVANNYSPGPLVFFILTLLGFVMGNIIILIKREINVPRYFRYIGIAVFLIYSTFLILCLNNIYINRFWITLIVIIFVVWFAAKYFPHKKDIDKVVPK